MVSIRGTKLFFLEFYNKLRPLRVPIAVIFCFSLAILLINEWIYQYPGNNYIRHNKLIVWFILFVNVLVFCRFFGVRIVSNETIQGYLLYFLVGALAVLSVNAIQYTPFNPIDTSILALEKLLHIDSMSFVIWTHQYPTLTGRLHQIYGLLTYEMVVVPVFVLTIKKFNYLYEYFHIMLIAICIGFLFYYFFPTTGPASNLNPSYFREEQLATGLKFWQIHHYQQPTTASGGMIAMPSFHVIWAWLNVYLIRFRPLCCLALAILNLLMTFSCVLLGWHYCLDVLGSIIVLMVSFKLYQKTTVPVIEKTMLHAHVL